MDRPLAVALTAFVVLGVIGVLLGVVYFSDNTTSGQEQAQVQSVEKQQDDLQSELDRTQKNLQGLRTFLSASSLPGPLTKIGAELRVLSQRSIQAMPVRQRSLIRGTAKGTGGAIRQNTWASCYLNATGTARRCALHVRQGARPWATVQFRVEPTGKVVWLATKT